MKLIVQICCFNEETTLPQVIADLPRELPGVDQVEFLVIDDGSTDQTVAVAHRLGVHHVYPLGQKRGLAVAYMTGITKALELGADIIVNTDGDNQYNADGLGDLIAPILAGRLDIVVGTRPIDDIEHFSPLKKRLQRWGSRVVGQFAGVHLPDMTSGFRAYSAEAAMRLHIFSRYTASLEIIIQAGRMNMRMGSIDIQVNPKTRESRLISSSGRYVWRQAWIIMRSYVTYKPLRTFCYAATAPILLGGGLCVRFLGHYLHGNGIGHIQSLILAAILLIAAFLMIVLGIIADLLSTNRHLIQEAIFLQRKSIYHRDETPVPTPEEPAQLTMSAQS